MPTPQIPLSPELRRILELVNTLSFDPPWDQLGNLDEANQWLAGKGHSSGLADDADRLGLMALRDAIRPILEANAGHGDPIRAWEGLKPFAEGAPLLVLPGPEPRLAAAAGGLSGTVGTILATIYDSVRDGSFGRLKLCRESTCAWAFYDESKNGSGAWCSMRVCGNRNKARRRRERSRPTS
jgi:predicted RNA-binding Zn ribbon-like protein